MASDRGKGQCQYSSVYYCQILFQVFVNFGNKAFRFDKVYGASASQEEVFDQSLKPLLADFINGIRSAAVVAYGQTGAGKTYTMGTNHVRVSSHKLTCGLCVIAMLNFDALL